MHVRHYRWSKTTTGVVCPHIGLFCPGRKSFFLDLAGNRFKNAVLRAEGWLLEGSKVPVPQNARKIFWAMVWPGGSEFIRLIGSSPSV